MTEILTTMLVADSACGTKSPCLQAYMCDPSCLVGTLGLEWHVLDSDIGIALGRSRGVLRSNLRADSNRFTRLHGRSDTPDRHCQTSMELQKSPVLQYDLQYIPKRHGGVYNR